MFQYKSLTAKLDVKFHQFSVYIFSSRLPYDWKTQLNYVFTMLAMALVCVPMLLNLLATICFVIGSCWLYISFMNDIINDLKCFNMGAMSSKRRQAKTKERFSEIIRNCSDVKELRLDFVKN